jgi:hypothetical protein
VEERVYQVLVYSLIPLVDRGGGAGLEGEVRPLDHRDMFHLVLPPGVGRCLLRLGTDRQSSLLVSPFIQIAERGHTITTTFQVCERLEAHTMIMVIMQMSIDSCLCLSRGEVGPQNIGRLEYHQLLTSLQYSDIPAEHSSDY